MRLGKKPRCSPRSSSALLGRDLMGSASRSQRPNSPERRGAQVSLRHQDGLAVMRAIGDRGVVGDFRPPDLCRFGLAPLYTRFVDLWDAVERIVDVVDTGMHRLPQYRDEVAIP